MTIEKVSLDARLREIEDRLDNIEGTEKMAHTTQVGGTYTMIEDIDDDTDVVLERLKFGFFNGVGATEDGSPDIGAQFGYRVKEGVGTSVFETNDNGLVLPAMPLGVIDATTTFSTSATSWTSIIKGFGGFSVLYNAVRVSFDFTASGGNAEFRLAETGGGATNFSSGTTPASSGIVDFRWLHERTLGDDNGPFIELQAKVSAGSVTVQVPYICHQVGGDHIAATTAGI